MITAEKLIAFLEKTFLEQGLQNAVIAVSGGIDSALSLSLLARAIPREKIFPLLLPYGNQHMDDAQTMCAWNSIPRENWEVFNIKKPVDTLISQLNIPSDDLIRRGNVMARVRMIAVYDRAKEKQALVVGTENKSEHYLGYFTRFGDAASDIEPISKLYKTQVRQMAQEMGIPQQILTKDPSAGLWKGQTDEDQLGFTYEQADKVLQQLVDKKIKPHAITLTDVSDDVVRRVVEHVQSQAFKLQVPYEVTRA